MTAYTAADHTAAVRRSPDLRLITVVDAKHGSGVVLSARPDSPGVLGFAAIDSQGGAAALALDAEEATALRDALTGWLEEQA